MTPTPSLRLQTLEARDVPALVGFDQLAVDPFTYDPATILVQWNEGVNRTTKFTVSAEKLGNGYQRLTLKPTVSVEEAIAGLEGSFKIAAVQPDYKVFVNATPDDSSFGTQWSLSSSNDIDIDAPEAWNTGTGNRRTIVAVIDTGVDYTHPDLAANMWKNTKEIAGNGVDDDGNGFKDDIYGWDFANNDNKPMDDNGHGTHVAGTIGAVGDNGIGVVGVNWNTRIMALKFLDSSGSGYLSDAVKALNYAVKNGAKVVNASFGGGYDAAMQAAVTAARAKGVIVVAAAGNDGTNNNTNPVYPANYSGDNLIAVASTDKTDKLSSFSNYGSTTVDLAAPGSSIYSTLPKGKYGTYSGTSMAAPHVAGAMALVWDTHPTWTYKQVIAAVLNTTDSLSSLSGKVAHGRLNVAKAMAYGGTTPTTPTPTPVDGGVTTQTFTSKNVGQTIKDYGTVVSTLTVSKDIKITDLNVTLNATHSAVGDLRVTLVAPDGTKVVLVNRRGGLGNHFTGTTFDDEGSTGIYTAAAPFAGSVRPEYVLRAFDGRSAKGTWKLIVEDMAQYDTGVLSGWAIQVTG